MARTSTIYLSRRETQIMDIVYAHGEASVNEVLAEIQKPPSYSAIRALMRILEDKGHLKHRTQGIKYLYYPSRARAVAAKAAMQRVLATFFGGSVDAAVVALLGASDKKLSSQELDKLAKLVKKGGK